MKGHATPILLGLMLLLLLGNAQAALIVNKYTNDFSVSSPYATEMKACACENRADSILVENTGNFHTTYRVEILAEQPEWYEASATEFTLAPGERHEFLVYVEPGCGTVGRYRYSVRIWSSYGRERILTRDLDVKRCQNAFLTVEGGRNESNLGQPITYTLTLRNVAEFADTFTLDFGSFTGFADLEERSFYLVPDEERRFDVTFTPPTSLYGEVIIPFTVTAEKNGVTEQKTAVVFIENQFDHEIVANTSAEYCSRVYGEYRFTVRNLIDVPNDYDVIVTGPKFMDYETKRIHLDGNEEKEIVLKLSPQHGQEGSHMIGIRVVSVLGENRKSRDVEIMVRDCFAFTLGFVEQATSDDGAFVDTACCGDKAYTLNIRNNGETEETYNVDVDGPAWFQPEERTIRLKPSENRNVLFHARLPCTDETYEVPVTVTLTRHPSIAETVLFRVESQTQRTCHAVELGVDSVSIDEEDGVVPLIVRSTGIGGGIYRIGLDAELYERTHEDRITLAPGEQALIHLETKGNLTDYFDGKYLGAVAFTYEPLGITYDEQLWTRFDHVGWLTTLWRSIVYYDYGALSPCLWLSLLLVVAIILVAIWLAVRLLRGTMSSLGAGLLLSLRIVVVALLLIVVLAVIFTPLPEKAELYEEPTETSAELILQWYENERYTIDLDDYFDDPDLDSLHFNAYQPAHIAVLIDGSSVTLVPERNWAGWDRIVFTADDNRGGMVDSPIMALHVLRRQRLTFLQWQARYCLQILLALLALLLLLLLLIVFLTVRSDGRRGSARTIIEPPARPKGPPSKAVHTVVTREGELYRLDEYGRKRQPVQETAPVVLPVAPKSAPKSTVKSAPKSAVSARAVPAKRTAAKSARSVALDRALVACTEKHEMLRVLETHGRRGTEANVKIVMAACKRFKKDKGYQPHNRDNFYRYLRERRVLVSLAKKTRKTGTRQKRGRTTAAPTRRAAATKRPLVKRNVAKSTPRAKGSRVSRVRVTGRSQKSALALRRAPSGRVASRPSTELIASSRSEIILPEPDYVEMRDPGNTVNIAIGTPINEPREMILIGAKDGHKVHDPQCIVAQRIPRDRRVSFTSKAEASKAGYGPCKVCQSFDRV